MFLKANAPAVAHHGQTVIGFNWIGGREVEGDLPSFDSRSPVDRRDTVGIFPECGERDMERAARAAAAAFPGWRATPAAERGAVLTRAGAILAERRDTVAAFITREVGLPPRDAQAEVQEALDLCRRFQAAAAEAAIPAAARPSGREWQVRREPVGVCGVLTSGRSPLARPCARILAALRAGDTVVWKPSADAPTTAYLLACALVDAGLPPGVLNVVNGRRNGCGKAFLAGLDKGYYQAFSCIGSDALARQAGAAAGRNLVPPSLEVGTRNALLVMADAPLEQAVRSAVQAAFGAGGVRTPLTSLLVHKDVLDAFRERLLAAVAKLEQGNPVSHPDVAFGPMLNPRLAQAFEEHWQQGRDQGARLLCGGERWTEANRSARVHGPIEKGAYFQPCVWDGVVPDMALFRTEVVGPTANLCAVDGFDQALVWANGLAGASHAALFTASRDRAERFGRECLAPALAINPDPTDVGTPAPWLGGAWRGGGAPDSGPWAEASCTRWRALDDAQG